MLSKGEVIHYSSSHALGLKVDEAKLVCFLHQTATQNMIFSVRYTKYERIH
jgi:hypothetical protein